MTTIQIEITDEELLETEAYLEGRMFFRSESLLNILTKIVEKVKQDKERDIQRNRASNILAALDTLISDCNFSTSWNDELNIITSMYRLEEL